MKKRKLDVEHKKKNSLEDRFGMMFIMMILISFILALVLVVISEWFVKDFILSKMIGLYGGTSFLICFFLTFVLIVVISKNILGRLVIAFFAFVTLYAAVNMAKTPILLYKDIDLYENQQFEKLVGIPNKVEYDDPNRGPEFAMELIFEDKVINVHSLNITREYYETELAGKSLEILYLPNSSYAVNVQVKEE